MPDLARLKKDYKTHLKAARRLDDAGDTRDVRAAALLLSQEGLYAGDKLARLEAAPPEGLVPLVLGWLQCVPKKSYERPVPFHWLARNATDQAHIHALILLADFAGQAGHAKDLARYRASEATLIAVAEGLSAHKSAGQRKVLAEALRFGASRALLPALQAAAAVEPKADVKALIEGAARSAGLASERLGRRDRLVELRGKRVGFSGRMFFEAKYASQQYALYLHHLQSRAAFLGATVGGDNDEADIVFVADDGQAAGPGGERLGGRDLFEMLGVRWYCGDLERIPSLDGWVDRLRDAVSALEAHPDVVVETFTAAPGLSDAAIDEAMGGLVVPDALRALVRQADGIQLRWSGVGVSGCVDIPPLTALMSASVPAPDGVSEVEVHTNDGVPGEEDGAAFYGRLRRFDAFGAAEAALYLHREGGAAVFTARPGEHHEARQLSLTNYLEGLLNCFGEVGFREEATRRQSPIRHNPFGWGGRARVMFARTPGG